MVSPSGTRKRCFWRKRGLAVGGSDTRSKKMQSDILLKLHFISNQKIHFGETMIVCSLVLSMQLFSNFFFKFCMQPCRLLGYVSYTMSHSSVKLRYSLSFFTPLSYMFYWNWFFFFKLLLNIKKYSLLFIEEKENH